MSQIDEKEVVMIIAKENFRDEELREPQKILEKQGAKVTIASSSLITATGMFGAEAEPDILIDDVKVEDYDAIVFVGGAGASEYWNNPTAHKIAKKAEESEKILGAICIAPVTLANAGVLEGKRATVWGSEVGKLKEKGANINYTHPVTRFNALHHAAFNRDKVMVKYLIDIGIEQNNLKGDVTLIRALSQDGKKDMAKYLTTLGMKDEGCETKKCF